MNKKKKPLIRLFKLCVLAIYCCSCQKSGVDGITDSIPGYQTFTIQKGNHFASPTLAEPVTKDELVFNVIFDNSAIYQNADTSNQKDINKLYGFSDCNTDHLTSSARIGWRWYLNGKQQYELQLLGFVHYNGVIQPDLIINTVTIGSVIKCRITCLPGKYQFEVNGKIAEAERPCSSRSIAYKLYPYFGGDETAPHTIRIFIDEQ